MKKEIKVKDIDSHGDIFVEGVDGYINSEISGDSLTQLCENYESAFGELPNVEQLKAALTFIDSFLAEIGTTSPRTKYAEAASRLSWIVDNESIIKTAENLGSIRTMSLKKH